MRTWIISYPRSGSNWVCYIIEKCLGVQVNGHQKVWEEGLISQLYQKSHDFKYVQPDDRLIFVVRDYKQCLHSFGLGKGDLDEFFKGQIDTWIELTNKYQSHPGECLIVNYDDILMGDDQTRLTVVSGLIKFCTSKNTEAFSRDFMRLEQSHRQSSLRIYGWDKQHLTGIIVNEKWDKIYQERCGQTKN